MRTKAVTRGRSSHSTVTAGPDSDRTRSSILIAMAVATACALLLVDTRAEATFDAPKRIAAMIGIAVAASLAFGTGAVSWRREVSRAHGFALLTGGMALLFVALSAAWSPRRAIAIDSLRTVLLFAIVPVIAAMPSLSKKVWSVITLTFTGASAVNALLSLAQTAGLVHLFRYTTVGGRGNTSALIGNDGQLGLTMAFAAVICLERLLSERRPRLRVLFLVLLVLTLAGLITNRGLTPVLTFGAGATVIAWTRIRNPRRVIAGFAIAAIIGALALMFYPPMRARAILLRQAVAGGDVNVLTSYRLGPWAAAVEMWKSRPILGWGPGTFASEFAPGLIRAEIHWRSRLVNPFLLGSYSEAHSTYLQGLAEVGFPAVILALMSAATTIVLSIRAFSRSAAKFEFALPVAIVAAGAVAALTWFPLQQPGTCLLILAAFGRTWRVSLDAGKVEA
jgi:O-antigen ligase